MEERAIELERRAIVSNGNRKEKEVSSPLSLSLSLSLCTSFQFSPVDNVKTVTQAHQNESQFMWGVSPSLILVSKGWEREERERGKMCGAHCVLCTY